MHIKLEFVPVVSKKPLTPRIKLERKIDKNGEHLDNYQLIIYEKMAYFVLLHELDHIEQVVTRFWAQGLMFFTTVLEEKDRGWRQINHYPGLITMWQNTILEYEVRLLEFIRLYQSNSDKVTTKESARQAVIWSQKYWAAVGLGQSKSKLAWEKQFTPNLSELRQIAREKFKAGMFTFHPYQIEKNPYYRS